MQEDAEARFIESWGSMGVLWGINRSMARIHALLVLAGEPVDLDRIAERLNISKGNASMSLKELRNWGVIQRVQKSGDRRDFYVVEPDVWRMFFRIAAERRKREFEPALHALRHLISEMDSEKNRGVFSRLEQMEDLLSTIEQITNRLLESEQRSRTMLDFFTKVASQ